MSRGNTGWVSPSFTYPLPAPGMVREGLRQLLGGGEAFVLRPSLDPALRPLALELPAQLQPGALRRRRAGAARAQPPDARAVRRLPRRRRGVRDAQRRPRRRGAHARRARPLPADLPAAARARLRGRRDRRARRRRARSRSSPRSTRRGVVAGLHARVDRFVRPEELTAGLAERLRGDGVEIREGCELRALERRRGGWALNVGPASGSRPSGSSSPRGCRPPRCCAATACACR